MVIHLQNMKLMACLNHTWAEDQEAYRKIFDYQSGNPDWEQPDNLRLGISWSNLRNLKSERLFFWSVINLRISRSIFQSAWIIWNCQNSDFKFFRLDPKVFFDLARESLNLNFSSFSGWISTLRIIKTMGFLGFLYSILGKNWTKIQIL